ncbi:hypothetical protein ACFOEY_15995 [Paracandidimonas soli]
MTPRLTRDWARSAGCEVVRLEQRGRLQVGNFLFAFAMRTSN